MQKGVRIMLISFLTSGPAFDVAVPPQLVPTPFVNSPIELHPGNPRSVTFQPSPFGEVEFKGAIYKALEPVSDGRGRSVQVIEHREPDIIDPVQWFLLWKMIGGTLYTHVRWEDGLSSIETTVSHLEIVDQPNTTPVALPSAPLKRAASRVQGLKETITFHSVSSDDGSFLRLFRPGGLRSSSVTRGDSVFVQTGVGIDIESSGLDQSVIMAIASDVSEQLKSG